MAEPGIHYRELIKVPVQSQLSRAAYEVKQALGEPMNCVGQFSANVNAAHQHLLGLDRWMEHDLHATEPDTDLKLPPHLVGEEL
ncbi:MAG: hypothetical protein PVG71_03215 [Anaerolineae bacterium]|jgi:hypothetical protein